MAIKTLSAFTPPDLSRVKDPDTKAVLEQLVRFLFTNQNNVYNDLQGSIASQVVYFGAEDVDGSWRIIRSGTGLAFERRESAVWVEKNLITP